MTINWNALGVSNAKLKYGPTLDIPEGLNKKGSRYWQEAVNKIKSKSPSAWDRVFQEYVSLCRKASVYPFDNRAANNDAIYKALVRGRRKVVRFIEKKKVSRDMQVYRTKRSVNLGEHGFTLTCEGYCNFMDSPPKAISKMGIRKGHFKYPTAWTAELTSNVTFYIANQMIDMSGRWLYGYTIYVPYFPFIAGMGAASTKQLEEFILKVIYLPILKTYRLLGEQFRLV